MITCTQQTLVKPNYTTPYSYKRPSYMQLARLVIECKNFNQYQLANKVFVCLLHQSIDSSVKLVWQSTNWNILKGYDWVLANPKLHRDLIIVDNGRLKVNMPATLLKENYMRLTYINASEIHVVNKKNRWCHPPRPERLLLPSQKEYLEDKLTSLVPNWRDLANKYLQPK